MRNFFVFGVIIIAIFSISRANAEDVEAKKIEYKQFIELRYGPGERYPIFNVVEKGDSVTIVGRKNDWLKVRPVENQNNIEGWIKIDELFAAIYTNNDAEKYLVRYNDSRRFETSVGIGQFSDDWFYQAQLGYRIWENIIFRLSGSKAIGDYSSSSLYGVEMAARFFMKSSISPVATVSLEYMNNKPRYTLVKASETEFTVVGFGAGVEWKFISNLRLHWVIKQRNARSTQTDSRTFVQWQTGLTAVF